MKQWRMWAVYAVMEGTLVSMHVEEEDAIKAAIEASMDNNMILTWTHVLVTQEDEPFDANVPLMNDHDDPPLRPPRLGEE